MAIENFVYCRCWWRVKPQAFLKHPTFQLAFVCCTPVISFMELIWVGRCTRSSSCKVRGCAHARYAVATGIEAHRLVAVIRWKLYPKTDLSDWQTVVTASCECCSNQECISLWRPLPFSPITETMNFRVSIAVPILRLALKRAAWSFIIDINGLVVDWIERRYRITFFQNKNKKIRGLRET